MKDKALIEQRTLMNPEFEIVNKDFFLSKKAILAEVERELQDATVQWIGYVDQDSKETNSLLEEPEADDATVAEECSGAQDRSANRNRSGRTQEKWCRENGPKLETFDES